MLASGKNSRIASLEFSLASEIVELVVLTADEAFLQTLREAVGNSRRVWHVLSSDKVSDLLVAGQVGILVLDVQALHETAAVFVSQIKRQFPDLVVVVAGNRAAETLLAGLISRGLVYRFIHKPMSPARARLFADAAVKRYEEQRHRAVGAANDPQAAALYEHPGVIAAVCAVAAVAALVWFMQQGSRADIKGIPAGNQLPTPAESLLLTHAAAALAANHLVSPATDNALDLYQRALAEYPSDLTARAGLNEVHERLLARAENALLEERLDEAAAAIQTARKAGAASERIAFLSTQLARSRSLLKAPAPTPRAALDAPTTP